MSPVSDGTPFSTLNFLERLKSHRPVVLLRKVLSEGSLKPCMIELILSAPSFPGSVKV